MNNQSNSLKSGFSTLFHIINVSRKVLLNILFFGFLLIFIFALFKPKTPIIVPEHTALVLNPVGDIVEQKHEIKPFAKLINDAMSKRDSKPEVLISDITKVIKHAAVDDHIKLLVLNLSNIKSAGLTKLRIIAKALTEFKASGKKVIAIADGYTQDQYYLASYADKVWLNPKGWLLLDGYGNYPLYFKSALSKLNITPHIFRVGTYKSAVEPYIRDDMSPAAKEANKQWMNELWSIYKQDVAKQRGFDVNNFDETSAVLVKKLTAADGDIAKYALTNHWVDALKTRPEMRQALIAIVGENKAKTSFNDIDFNDYLASLNSVKSPIHKSATGDKVAIIVAKGVILDGEQKPGNIGGDSTAALLEKARKNPNVKAVVLRVDSPGGSAYASDVIRQEIELLKKAGKPVIASMGTYAASGGYWISAPADAIVAEPTTITGSIGIFGMLMTIDKSLATLGIHSDGVGTTDFAGFNITRPLTNDMATLFQLSINHGYQNFLQLVADNRHMTVKQVDAVAQGHVWTGATALKLGLVDRLGDLHDAIKLAADNAKLTHYSTLLIEQKLSAKDRFIESVFSENSLLVKLVAPVASAAMHDSIARQVTNDPVSQLIDTLKAQYQQLAMFNDPQGRYTFCVPCGINN